MFKIHTLNKNTNKCICCTRSQKVSLELKYSILPFKYLKYIESHIFFVNICNYCYLNSFYDKHIYNEIFINSINLLEQFINYNFMR